MGMRRNSNGPESHFAKVVSLPVSNSQAICHEGKSPADYKALLKDSLAKIDGSFMCVDDGYHEVIESTLETLKSTGIVREESIIVNEEGESFIRTKEGILSVRQFLAAILESD